MKHLEAPVLVVGGGPVGLSTALHLAAQGIDSILIEKHPTTAHHPKASYFNARTMEILRDRGLVDDVVIESAYVVACDGVRSATRQELDLAMIGPPAFGHLINIYIEADLERLVEEHDQAL